MARIRSTHPGQWSDEDFVALTFPARLLALSVRNIADDHGLFEWKPRTLKMQLFPADSIDVAGLLPELVTNNIVMKFEIEGKHYGAIRNFMRWQRPKKPSYSLPTCPEVLEYVGANATKDGTEGGSDDGSSEPVPNQSPTEGEKSPQRKEEGGSGSEEETGSFAKAQEPAADLGAPAAKPTARAKPHPKPSKAEPKPAKQDKSTVADWSGSDEEQYWAAAGALEAKGVGRSMCGELANLLNGDFTTGLGTLRDAAKAREPRPYLAKSIRNLKHSDRPATGDPDAPSWVNEARIIYGYPVEREGEHWRMAGALYDDLKTQVGN